MGLLSDVLPPMGPVSGGFAIACLVTLAVCMVAALVQTKALDLFGTAAFVFVMFWVSRGVSQGSHPPLSMGHYPLQDVVLLGILWWTGRLEVWRGAVGLFLLMQLGLHAVYWGLYVSGGSPSLWNYVFLNNIGLAGILLALTVQGGSHVLDFLADLRVFNRLPGWGGASRVSRLGE